LVIPFRFSSQLRKRMRGRKVVCICDSAVVFLLGKRAISIFNIFYLGYMRKIRSSLAYFPVMFLKAIIQIIGNIPSRNIAVSNALAAEMRRTGLIVKEVISNSVDTERFIPMSINKREGICYVAKFNYFGKGFDKLANVITGGLEVQVHTNRNEFLGRPTLSMVPHEEMVYVYNRYKILLSFSRYESFGLTIIEALACGVPVITSCVGVAGELKELEPVFVLPQRFTGSQIRERIDIISRNYEHYGKKAREIAVDKYSLSAARGKWEVILQLE
jgi:glycosyltransferase involved in cell wall biosynthesis